LDDVRGSRLTVTVAWHGRGDTPFQFSASERFAAPWGAAWRAV